MELEESENSFSAPNQQSQVGFQSGFKGTPANSDSKLSLFMNSSYQQQSSPFPPMFTPYNTAQNFPSFQPPQAFQNPAPQSSMFGGFGSNSGSGLQVGSFANRPNVFDQFKDNFDKPKRPVRATRAKIQPENLTSNGNDEDPEDGDFELSPSGEEDEFEGEEEPQLEGNIIVEGNPDSDSDSFNGLVDEDEEQCPPIDLNDYMQKRPFL